ncbi:response regulator [Shouchella hunanensis]|uniref:Response regulator n=1 Tax=Shouchella hunanensis TaxID=766894 RepID=A0ABY7W7T6_9BACI|nr:helix-turn-helix domain-containing protein [Shouchella hunanensis]WDF04671.1 response regulator [Shouchella hunanensis]GAF21859.1 two-component response regulator YesN [Bacillus sp. JCM 19047]
MYQLLIVDDEDATLQGLASLPWHQLTISQVHCARSARKANEILAAFPIDVLITDIRMPGRSGLELLQDVTKFSIQPKCILLSGYSDFSYAQAAIKAQAVDYLLKPVRDEELIYAVEQALVKKIEEKKERYMQEQTVAAIKSNLSFVGESVFQPWISGEKGDDALKAELVHYGMAHQSDIRTIPITVRVEHSQNSSHGWKQMINEELAEAYVLLEKHVSLNAISYLLYPVHHSDPLLVEKDVHDRAVRLRKALKKDLFYGVTIKVGAPLIFWKQAKQYLRKPLVDSTSEEIQQDSLAKRVKEFIDASFMKQPTLQDIATNLYLNPSYVSKRFKEETGETLTDYIHRLRMNRAVTLLTQTNMKVSLISEELGYQHASYFIRVFKKEFKQTPHEFRQR